MAESPKLFAGVDWATEIHQACVVEASGEIVAERAIPNSGEGLSDFCTWLLELADGSDRSSGPFHMDWRLASRRGETPDDSPQSRLFSRCGAPYHQANGFAS
jgi:hypothetical protein